MPSIDLAGFFTLLPEELEVFGIGLWDYSWKQGEGGVISGLPSASAY